jgi:hypothetical protein
LLTTEKYLAVIANVALTGSGGGSETGIVVKQPEDMRSELLDGDEFLVARMSVDILVISFILTTLLAHVDVIQRRRTNESDPLALCVKKQNVVISK